MSVVVEVTLGSEARRSPRSGLLECGIFKDPSSVRGLGGLRPSVHSLRRHLREFSEVRARLRRIPKYLGGVSPTPPSPVVRRERVTFLSPVWCLES